MVAQTLDPHLRTQSSLYLCAAVICHVDAFVASAAHQVIGARVKDAQASALL